MRSAAPIPAARPPAVTARRRCAIVLTGLLAGLTIAGCVHDVVVRSFPHAVALLASVHPDSPAALQARLEYAGRLAQGGGKDCARRLDEAQSQLDAVAASPALAIVLPLGPARLANLEYRVHAARASCGAAAARRPGELRLALAAAQRSVDLYRGALDYPSMATMQFNVAATERLLGEQEAAVAALRSAMQMDREYGLREDEEENETVLADWTGQPVRARAPVAPRSTTLKFGWRASDAQVRIEVSLTSLINGQVSHLSAAATVQRHVHRVRGGWLVSHEPGPIAAGPATGLTDKEVVDTLVIPFSQALLELPDIKVSKVGDLLQVVADDRFAAHLIDEAADMAPRYSPTHRKISSAEREELTELFSPGAIEAQVDEDYGFETQAWIGATLQQGVWYSTAALLGMPGLDAYAPHNVEMAYTRDLPCVAGALQPTCVEIVVHATPQWNAVRPEGTGDVAWSATYIRLVTDPASLTPYRLEKRTYWYFSQGPKDLGTASQTIVATFTYRSS